MNHSAYVSKLDKYEAKNLIALAQARIDALDEEKQRAIADLDAACSGRQRIPFYGQDLYVVGGVYYPGGGLFGSGPRWKFELENGSLIVIDLEKN